MRLRSKNTAAAQAVPAPGGHRAPRKTTTPAVTVPGPALVPPSALGDDIAREWLLRDAQAFEDGAARNRAEIDRLTAEMDNWRIAATEYRRLAARYDEPEPQFTQWLADRAPVERDPDPDPTRYNPTWTVTPQIIEQADVLVPPLEHVHAALWSPGGPRGVWPVPASAWSPQASPNDGATATFPPVNGDAR